MLFNTFEFLIFIVVVLAVYYVAVLGVFKRNVRVANALLLCISYIVYFYYEPKYTLVLAGVTAVTWFFALKVGPDRRKWLIWLGLTLTVIPLAVFKYGNFIIDNIAGLLSVAGMDFNRQHFSIVIPIGISFFTFQAFGYLYDVYSGKIKAERNFADYMLFVSFFPQIASGPISKADELLPQIKGKRSATPAMIASGLKTLLWGYFLKAVFADRVALYADPVFANYDYFSGASCFVASCMYSLQIYGDFAGYSLMAVGVGRLFGFDLINNFRRPYFSTSVTDFWRRWHISLSRWLKDYVYIPAGGSRRGKFRTYANIMATFFVSGLWHGANWTFIAWGVMHGFVQCVEKFLKINLLKPSGWKKVAHILVTFLIVNFAWIFFKLPTFGDAWRFICRIFSFAPGQFFKPSSSMMVLMVFAIAVVFIKELVEERNAGVTLINHRNRFVRWTTCVALVVAIVLCGVLDSSQFIYVNF